MKLKLGIVVLYFYSHFIAMDNPKLLIPIGDQWESAESDHHAIGLNDFGILKDAVGIICKKPFKTISLDFKDIKVPRTRSEGQVDKIDCQTIELQVHKECQLAAERIKSIAVCNSFISSSAAQDNFNYARARYQNAFHLLIISFGLKCYNSLEKLHQVLAAFIESETSATQKLANRKLDQKSQALYYQLDDMVQKEKNRRTANAPQLIPIDNTRALVSALGESFAQKSFQDGAVHFDAARALSRTIHEPTVEGVDSIEIFFFMAFEHFIASFNKGDEKGLAEAGKVVEELKKLHDIRMNKFSQSSKRYELAKAKLEHAKELTLEHIRHDPSEHHDSSGTSYLERILREDATQAHPQSSADNTHAELSISENQSDLAVRESTSPVSSSTRLNHPLPPATTPLSLLKTAVSKTAAGGKWVYACCKKLWKKL